MNLHIILDHVLFKSSRLSKIQFINPIINYLGMMKRKKIDQDQTKNYIS